jgi:hypothetical protein
MGFPIPPTLRHLEPKKNDGYKDSKERKEDQFVPVPKPSLPHIEVATSKYEEDRETIPVPQKTTEQILNETLSPQHRDDPNVLRFINSYLSNRDVKQASKDAGITKSSGPVLLGRNDIRLAITRLTDAAFLKYGFDAHDVVEKVKEVVNFDPADIFNEDGTFKENIHDIPPETRRAIKRIKVKNLYDKDPNGMNVVIGKLMEVEFHDKIRSAELIGREVEVFKKTSKVEHDVTRNMKDTLLASKALAENRLARLTTARDVTNDDKASS